MKRTAAFVSLAFAASLAFGSMALAEEKSSKEQKEGYGSSQTQSQSDQSQSQQQQQAGIQAADDIKGFAVQNNSGERIGEISELLVDVEQGKIGYAVVSSGGVLGMGEEKYIVPFKALQFDQGQNVLTIDMQKEQLKQAPEGDVAQALDRQQGQEIHQFYGVSPYWEEGGAQQQSPDQQQSEQQQLEPQQLEPQQSPMQQEREQQSPQQQQNRM